MKTNLIEKILANPVYAYNSGVVEQLRIALNKMSEQTLRQLELIMDQKMQKPVSRFAIGTEFMTRGKAPKRCKVVDIHYTYNSKNELVSTKYVAEHEFMGQVMTDEFVLETTIAMGISDRQ